jgi:hypothetical protein
MPPKKAAVPTGGDVTLSARNVAVLTATFRKMENIQVDWAAVGNEPDVNIGLARNA